MSAQFVGSKVIDMETIDSIVPIELIILALHFITYLENLGR